MMVARDAEVEALIAKTVEGLPMLGEVHVKPLMAGERMTMLVLHYPTGAGSPTHTHGHESLCYVVRGRAKMTVGEEAFVLEAGDACRHPDGVPHSVEAVEDTTVLEIKSPAPLLGAFLGTE